MKKMYFFLVALFCVLSCQTITAQYADSIANAVVIRSDVELTIQNDATYPWTTEDGYIKNGNTGVSGSVSELTFTFTSSYKTELSFDWKRYTSYNYLYLYVDGTVKASNPSSSYSTVRVYLEAGTHTIVFRDTVYNASTSVYAYVKNIKIKEIRPLEISALSPHSQPITFTNDTLYPWTIEDGYIQSGNYGHSYSTSTISTTFTIDKPALFSYESWVNRYDEYTSSASTYHEFKRTFTSDNVDMSKFNNLQLYQYYTEGWIKKTEYLQPGTYTITFRDSIKNTTTFYYSRLRNITLSSDWLEVELAYAGTLGVEVLYKVDVLNDAYLLKIKGNLNATDWDYIKQMKNLVALDLTEAVFDAVPNSAFSGLYYLTEVKLPEGITEIGNSAFSGTQILEIDIPASVTRIGTSAFANTRIRYIHFPDNSQLTTIGQSAFEGCTSLQEFIMPNTVTQLEHNNGTYFDDSDTFYGCTAIKKIHFSNKLQVIEGKTCYQCGKLTEIKLPDNLQRIGQYAFYKNTQLPNIKLPESLSRIDPYAFSYCKFDSVILPLKLSSMGVYAFSECTSLKYIELPSYLSTSRSTTNTTSSGYSSNFSGCDAINKVVCKSATPPVITSDPFSNGPTKSNITLVVPSFAVTAYKLDSYWYKFGTIEEGEPLDYWKITDDLMLTNNRRMEGTPDIEIATNGRLTAAGAAPFPINRFMLYFSSSSTSALLNNCKDMYADSVISYYNLNAKDKWYFIVPLYDIDLTRVVHQGGAPFVFRYYDAASRAANGTGSSWKNVTDSVLRHGEGYIIRSNATGWMTLPPVDSLSAAQVFHTEDVTIPLNAQVSDNTANAHWNYVGNPYPCYYDIWYMDFPAPITVWTGSTYKAYSLADDSYALRPMEAFFVQKPDEISEITFHKEGRQVNSDITHTANAPQRRNAVGTNRDVFNITITAANGLSDDTRVVINEQAQRTYEIHCDASKFMSMDAACPQIYTLDDQSTPLAINERPRHEGVVRAGFYAAAAGEYTITAAGAEGILIRDLDRQITHNLEVADYRFTVTEAGLCDTRFEFIFTEKQPVVTDIEDTYAALQISNQNGVLTINNAPADVLIYTVDGRLIEHAAADNTIHFTLQPGVYVIQVGNVMSKQIIH